MCNTRLATHNSLPIPQENSMAIRQAWYTRFARTAARVAGNPAAFFLAMFTIVVWGALGPLFEFSDTWQLVINTGTTIVTFLMVFLIQSSQNRDIMTVHVKLDELVRAVKAAKNTVLDLEGLDETELEALLADYQTLAAEARAKLESAVKRERPGTG